MAKKYAKKSKEEFNSQKKQMKETIEQEQNNIWYEEGTLLDFLKFAAVFHNYSVNNQILIYAQKPAATMVATFHKWNQRKRSVKKGEKGIAIFSPTPQKRTVEKDMKDAYGNYVYDADGTIKKESKEVSYMSYRVEYVFDVSQTEGERLPELESVSEDPLFETAGDLYDALSWKHASISPDMSVSTILTNVTQECFLDEYKGYEAPEIDACSYILSSYCQFGGDGYSVGRILNWAKGKTSKEVTLFMGRVQKIAKMVIKEMEGQPCIA